MTTKPQPVNPSHPESSERVTPPDPTLTTRVTLDDALSALRKAVDEKGADYLYGAEHDSCLYAVATETGVQLLCIVGHVLDYLGVPLTFLTQDSLSKLTVLGLRTDLARVGYQLDSDAANALFDAQRIQDRSTDPSDPRHEQCTWGAALHAAEAGLR